MRDAVVFPYWDAVFDATVERGHPPETLYDHLADDETARRTVQAGFRATTAVTAPGVLDAVLGQFAGDVPSAPNPLGGSVPLSTVAAIGTAFADLTHLVRSTHGHTRSAQPAVAPADGVRVGRADAALAEPGVDGAGRADGRVSRQRLRFALPRLTSALSFRARMSSVPERSDIEDEYKWDLESIYASDEDWEAAFGRVEERLEEVERYEGRVTESPETLLELLELEEEIMRDVSKVVSYARLRSAEDTRNQEYQALSAKAENLSSKASSAVSFVEPELQELDQEDVEAFVEEEPALAEYEHYFDDVLRMKPHTRSAEVEELLADLSDVTGAASDVYSMLANADMTFPTVEKPDGDAVEITQGNFTKLQKHPDREFRREVYEEFYGEWEDVRNSVGAALKNSTKKDVKLARARNYDTAREASLDGPKVPVEVYDNLLETVRDNLDKLQKHAELKRRALDVDALRMWDLYMSVTGDEGPEIEWEQAVEWVTEAVAPLGEEYQQRMAEGLESRWVDVYENRGKRSGAFSAGTYDTQPFIMMNYQDNIDSLFTLAHELGHSMHSELAKDEQPWQYADYDIFVAEVASTVNETLLTHYLLENVDDEELKRHVLDQYLERVRSTLYRQTMFADFELQIHQVAEEGGALTPDTFDEIYGDLKAEFYADAEIDDHIPREWMRIPHFYYSYYVYQYSTGISAAASIVERIREEGEEAAADYREALRMGGGAYPIEVLETAGVDMTSPDPVEDALSVYDDYLDEMAELEGLN
jgi:oligoendopeptidase F